MDLRDSAAWYAVHGWYGIPVHSIRDGVCTCGKAECDSPGKHPHTKNGLKDASNDPVVIERWWRRWPDSNVGICTGARSGIVALDIDPRHGGDESLEEFIHEQGELPQTVEAITGGGGRHLIFIHPGGTIRNRTDLLIGIDVRGDGGYIVGPPSSHVSGVQYRWRDGHGPREINPAAIPPPLLELMTAEHTKQADRNKPVPANADGVGKLVQAGQQYVARCAPASEGGRNNAAFNVAGHLFSFVTDEGLRLSESQVLNLLRPWNDRNSPPLSERELEQVVSSATKNGAPRSPHIVRTRARDFGDGQATGNTTTSTGATAPVLVKLSAVQPEPVRWLWPQRIALGKLTLIAGDPGLGKSFLTLDVAARVSCGGGWPDNPLSSALAGGVVLLSAEDDVADTIRPRLDAAGADVSRIVFLQAVRTPDPEGGARCMPFTLSSDLPALEQAIQTTPDCKLVTIDPISAYLGGGIRFDSHRNTDVRAVLAPLAELAARRGVAVVAVTHLRKSEGPSMYRPMGSLAFVAAARAVWAVGRDKHDPARRLFLPVKCNLAGDLTGLAFTLHDSGGTAPPCVAWEPEPVDTSVDDALATPFTRTRGPEPEQQARAAEWLRRALVDGPRLAKELTEEGCEGEGLSKRTIKRARQAIGVVAYRNVIPGPWSWRLPGQECQMRPGRPEQRLLGTLGTLAKSGQKRGFLGSPDPEVSKDAKLPVLGSLGLEGASDATPGCPDGELPPDDCLENTAAVQAEGDGWGDL